MVVSVEEQDEDNFGGEWEGAASVRLAELWPVRFLAAKTSSRPSAAAAENSTEIPGAIALLCFARCW